MTTPLRMMLTLYGMCRWHLSLEEAAKPARVVAARFHPASLGAPAALPPDDEFELYGLYDVALKEMADAGKVMHELSGVELGLLGEAGLDRMRLG